MSKFFRSAAVFTFGHLFAAFVMIGDCVDRCSDHDNAGILH
ncbi:hypothetical protein HMPREF0758_4330 [Serratia odorifera DSM 4582]|uniref:Uncharacterized protein n=1 Tax=Serratia odorifera DSM 4582 TaxID=667129 RepID=D4E830_SEROD|nr:hypothetical protein HMPREF0758_4330 [Serratia odorifera DSM 4582]